MSKALAQYFRSKEPNGRLPDEAYTSVYNHELVDHLQHEVLFLQAELQRVHGELQATMLLKTSLLSRVLLRIKGRSRGDSNSMSVAGGPFLFVFLYLFVLAAVIYA